MSHLLRNATTLLASAGSIDRASQRFLILDDIFPQLLSAFRIAEYNAYLSHFEMAQVHSTAKAFPLVGEHRSFREVVEEYENLYPEYRNRVYKFHPWQNYTGRLVYTMFLNNAFRFVDVAERHAVPFVFTLYPGGGFQLNVPAVDERLRRVLSSPTFGKVIVTQRILHEYLVNNKLCPADKMEFIYGGVLPADRLGQQGVTKKYYQKDKDTFDICFMANKYTQRGVDKGYDVFVEVAKSLARSHQDIFFHVVGPFDETDIDVSRIENRIEFYGMRSTDFFPLFYSSMDVCLSPNAPFVLGPGSFDGFPTGSSVEAGLCGVAVFCTDVLNLNVALKDGEEIVIISRDVDDVCSTIDAYYRNYDDLYALARKGKEAFRRVFGYEAQMLPRLRILGEYGLK